MNHNLTQITDYLLTQSWQIAVLVAIMAMAGLALKNRSAHVRYLLWLIVLAKCLVPPLFTVPLAVLPQEKPPEPLLVSPVRIPMVAPDSLDTTLAESPAPPATPAVAEPAPTVAEMLPTLTLRQWLGFGWLAGVAAFLLFVVIKTLRTSRWLRRQRKLLPAELDRSVEKLFSDVGVRTLPKVWLIEGIGQPFVWGLLRGSIYLPANFLTVGNAEHRRVVLGHELSHVLRIDAAVNLLQVIAQAIFWFHPLVWWANKRIRAEREKCCDEMAIARWGAKARDYSDAIVNILICEQESTRPVPSLAVAGPVKNIEERIKTMLRPGKKFYKRPSLMAVSVILLLALLTVPTAIVLTAEAQEKTTAAPLPAPTAKDKAAATAGLFRAIKAKNVERLRLAITQGADLEAKNKDGCTPLYAAVATPGLNRAMIKLLLEAGANPNARDPRGQIPLHVKARGWHISGVNLLVSAGSDVNARDKKGVSPAMIAFEHGSTDMFDLMVARGAIVSTDLMSAYKGDLSRVRSLIENGKAQETFERGLTLLHAAAAGGHTAIVELLLTNGLNVHSKTQAGYTALHHAAAGNHREVAKLLLVAGADVNAEPASGWSYTTPSYLLPDVHPEPANQTPLHWAIREGHKDMVEWLLARGANPNADGGDYHPLGSPLNWAVWWEDVDIAGLLVSHGADIHRKSRNYLYTPLHDAVWRGGRAMAEALVTKAGDTIAAKWAPLHATVASADRQAVEDLLAKGADVNAKGEWGLSALHVAAAKGHKDIAELLITRGADVDEKAEFDSWRHGGWTPLYFAICHGHSDVAELLVAKGADVNVKDKRSLMPLHLALYSEPADLAELLVAKDADVNARDTWGQTPLHIAARHGYTDITGMLLDKGANPNAKDLERGITPLHTATRKGYTDITRMLLDKGAIPNAKEI